MKRTLMILSLAFALGCSGQQSSVSGVVSLDGKPLDRGAVSFHAVGGGPTAIGQIDSSGRYSVRVGAEDGLPPGEYVVTVVASEAPISTDGFESPVPGKLITPARYGSTATSDLKKTVTGGSNKIDLALTSP